MGLHKAVKVNPYSELSLKYPFIARMPPKETKTSRGYEWFISQKNAWLAELMQAHEPYLFVDKETFKGRLTAPTQRHTAT